MTAGALKVLSAVVLPLSKAHRDTSELVYATWKQMLQLVDSMPTSHVFGWVPLAVAKKYSTEPDHKKAIHVHVLAAKKTRKTRTRVYVNSYLTRESSY